MTQSWDYFEKRRLGAQPVAPTDADFDVVCAHALGGGVGEKLLLALWEKYFSAPQDLNAPESALRVRATQQQFVRDLEAARARGIAALSKRDKAG